MIQHKSSTKTVFTKATNIDLSSFSELLHCPSYKSDDLNIDEDNFSVCNKCHQMSNKKDCIKPSTIKFSINDDELIDLRCDPNRFGDSSF